LPHFLEVLLVGKKRRKEKRKGEEKTINSRNWGAAGKEHEPLSLFFR